MSSAVGGSASRGPRYAPPDPTLPKPWRALIDGSTGYLYFWNPETKAVQYDRPAAATAPEEKTRNGDPSEPRGEAAVSHPQDWPPADNKARNDPSQTRREAEVSRPQNVPPTDNRSRSDPLEPHSAAGVSLVQNVPPTNPTPAASGTRISPEAYRAQYEITVLGNEAPAPFMTFQSTGFPPEILREIQQAGFSTPTPIQAQSWPIALNGRDIVAVAKTGSGKTLGYLLPGFMLLKRLQRNSRDGPTVLVLSPTRELATQIQDEAIKFGRSSRISSACLYGGAPKGPQLKDLDRGADIVVATPGRLNDILEMRRVSLHQVSYLVLDEADRMLDMGFEPQIRKIVKQVPPRRQTLMFTATWPKEVRKIALDLLVNPVQVNIGNTDELVANKSITQHVEVITHMEKPRRLEQILRSQEVGSKVIIFCSTKRMCDQLARNLSRQYSAAAIHGDKSQAERDSVLSQFRSGRSPILVATDVAARGLDIKDIRVVVNYDFPTGVEDYVHRIGRTGRAGATGAAYTFFCDQDSKYASDLVKILEGANQSVPSQLRDMVLRGGYGGRSRRWAASASDRDYSYSGQGYDSSYAKSSNVEPSTNSFHNSSLNNQSRDGSSFHASFHNSSSNSQFGDRLSSHASFPDSTSNDQSGGFSSFHARFYGASRGTDNENSSVVGYGASGRDDCQARSSNHDVCRSRSRSPPVNVSHGGADKSEALGVTTW